MDKTAFLNEIKHPLKMMGYRKNKNYWYKSNKDFLYCINVQGSQWDTDDYYVEIGIAFQTSPKDNPTLLQWHCRHRCKGENGEKNILPAELFATLAAISEKITSLNDIEAIMIESNATKIATQYWF